MLHLETTQKLIDELNEDESNLSDSFYEFVEKVEEKFGVHDFSSEEGDLAGYSSYEILKKKIETHINKFVDWFNKNGFKVTEIETI